MCPFVPPAWGLNAGMLCMAGQALWLPGCGGLELAVSPTGMVEGPSALPVAKGAGSLDRPEVQICNFRKHGLFLTIHGIRRTRPDPLCLCTGRYSSENAKRPEDSYVSSGPSNQYSLLRSKWKSHGLPL